MAGKNGNWNVQQAYFQGYVKNSLEVMKERQDKSDASNSDNFRRIYEHLENNTKVIERLKVKIGIIVAGASALFTFIWNKLIN